MNVKEGVYCKQTGSIGTPCGDDDMPTARKINIFISYKRGKDNALNFQVNAIHRYLKGFKKLYNVWMDTKDLKGSEDWMKAIQDNIRQADIILVPVAPKTAESKWVSKEIDMGRGAHITILPVLIQGSDDEVGLAMETLGLSTIQRVDVRNGDDADFQRIKAAIESCKDDTRKHQREWLSAIIQEEGRLKLKDPAEPRLNVKTYRVKGISCAIHLAAGDMTQHDGIDVLINPENDYLQMARIFESSSISSKLRLLGSLRNKSGHPIDDTVQMDLYELLRSGEYHIPVVSGTVIPTHAGHPQSELVKTKGVRYVFHVVTVTVRHNSDQNRIRPIDDPTIAEAVSNCLDMVLQINQDKGVISPTSSPRYKDEEKNQISYTPIQSILFPMFATGQGTRQSQEDIRRVARTVSESIDRYLRLNPKAKQLKLKHIYICGYADEDVDIIQKEMNAVFDK